MLAIFSFKDRNGLLFVDCFECTRGYNGDKSCCSGAFKGRAGMGYCPTGDLLEKYKKKKWLMPVLSVFVQQNGHEPFYTKEGDNLFKAFR